MLSRRLLSNRIRSARCLSRKTQPYANIDHAAAFTTSDTSLLVKNTIASSLGPVSASPGVRSLSYAVVNHAKEYQEAMEGRHGQQLKLAFVEGEARSDEVFDPFEAYQVDDEDEDDEEGMLEAGDGDDMEEEGEDEDEDAAPTLDFEYNKDGSIRRTKSQLASLKAGAAAGGKFAIVNLHGTQEKVTIDDVVILNKLKPVSKWSVGSTHTLNAENGSLLLVGSPEQTLVGMPFVNGAEVDVMVEEITRDKKVVVFKKKRRKNYRRKNGHKREVTFLRVLDIRFPEEVEVEAQVELEDSQSAVA